VLSDEEIAANAAIDREKERQRRMGNWRRIADKMGMRYENCRLDTFNFYGSTDEQKRQHQAIESAADLVKRIQTGFTADDGLVLFGPPGTGKDHILSAGLRAACAAGLSCEWLNGLDFFGDMRDRIDAESPESKVIRDLAAPDILAISDPLPPWGPLTNFQAQTLFRVIDRRYRHEKPIWVTINVSGSDEASERIGNAAVDRLKERALTIHCNWPSYRTREITRRRKESPE
jgi:DNA replication protein DnaC